MTVLKSDLFPEMTNPRPPLPTFWKTTILRRPRHLRSKRQHQHRDVKQPKQQPNRQVRGEKADRGQNKNSESHLMIMTKQ